MTNETGAVGRRERLRAQTLQEIEDASFAIIDTDGVHALSIAALARSMVMSAPAVYRYFPSRDALVAHLITRCYQQLTAAMSQAAAGDGKSPRERVALLVAAYRDWALRHRWRYGMLFGTRPGDTPDEGPTRTPLDQSMARLIDLVAAVQGGEPADDGSGDPTLDGQLRGWASVQGRPGATPRAGSAAILIWTRVHGIVSLELTGVFGRNTIEARRLIDLEIDNAIQSLGQGRP
ncbi:MAG: TetR/AcrR family transcriptional regulator [Trebonia sp.]